MRAHGSGRACYKGYRLPDGACDACKDDRREYARRWIHTPEGKASNQRSCDRYRSTAKGQLAILRYTANKRGS
jgi:hypothetical protein